MGGIPMLCEECKINEATVFITMHLQEEKRTKHLCQECVDKLKLDFEQGDIENFLTSLMAIMPKTTPTESLQCSVCHLSYETFQKTGKLGCAQCYEDFKEQLQPLLRRIHGRTQHAGRVPFRYEFTEKTKEKEEEPKNLEKEQLRIEMAKAIEEENFEQAAIIRDKLKALTDKGEKCNDQQRENT